MSSTAVFFPDARPLNGGSVLAIGAMGLCLIGGLLLLDLSVACLFVGWAAFAVCAYYNLEEAVLLLLFFLPFNLQRDLPGGSAVFEDLAKMLTILPFLLHHEYRRVLFGSKLCRVFLAAFFVGAVLAIPRALDLGYTAKLLLRQFSAISFGLIAAAVFRKPGQSRRLLVVIVASAAINGAYALFQQCIGGFGGIWSWINPEIAKFLPWEGRSTGLMNHMNSLGNFMTISLCLVVPFLVEQSKKNRRWAWVIPVMLGGLLVSFSRGAWASLIVACIVFFAFYGNRRVLVRLMLAGAVALLVVAATGIGTLILHRITNIEPTSEYGRLLMWAFSLNLFMQHPLFGIGYGNWGTYFFDWVATSAPALLNDPAAIVPWPHNIYVQILAESGFLGFMILLGPLIYLMVRAFRFRSLGGAFEQALVRAGGVAMLAAFCIGMVAPLFDGDISCTGLFWVIVGLLTFSLESRKSSFRAQDLSF